MLIFKQSVVVLVALSNSTSHASNTLPKVFVPLVRFFRRKLPCTTVEFDTPNHVTVTVPKPLKLGLSYRGNFGFYPNDPSDRS